MAAFRVEKRSVGDIYPGDRRVVGLFRDAADWNRTLWEPNIELRGGLSFFFGGLARHALGALYMKGSGSV